MKVAVLFSGGKDSTYAAYLAKQSGHDLQCLVTANPYSAESKLLIIQTYVYIAASHDSSSPPDDTAVITNEKSQSSSDCIYCMGSLPQIGPIGVRFARFACSLELFLLKDACNSSVHNTFDIIL